MLEQGFMGYALVFAIVFLGFIVVCIPRPRGIAFASPEDEKKHKKRLQNAKNKKKKEKKAKASKKANKKTSKKKK